MTILLEQPILTEQGIFNIDVQRTVQIAISAETAKRRVGIFVGDEIADLLHGDMPTLVVGGAETLWRVPVIFSSRTYGRIGEVGHIDVDVLSGRLIYDTNKLESIKLNAQRFAVGAAL